MISFLLRLFAVVVFFLLAAQWVIHTKEFQWGFGASSAFVASFLVEGGPVFPWQNRQPPQ